jgi:hypothetical protein
MRDYHLRVINPKGEPVPDIVIQAFEYKFEGVTARTDGDGRAKIAFDALVDSVHFRARQGDAAIAWGHYGAEELGPEASAADPLVLTMFPRNQRVEGTIVNSEGQPIRGVQVQVSSIYHPSNGSDGTFEPRQSASPLGSAVTDETGRYALVLPEESTASLSAYHPFYVGTSNGTKENGPILDPWTLMPAGRIVGFVRSGETKAPVAHARVYAQRIDINPPILGGGTSNAETDETGRFEMGSLAVGVYNLILKTSGRDRTQTAAAVEGVRVRPYEDSRADLTVITPRLLHGTAVDFNTGEPLANIPVFFYSASHPQSGAACPGTKSDEQGKFVCPVPPGDIYVYIASLKYRGEGSAQTVTVPADGEVPTVILKGGAAWKKPPPPPPYTRVTGLVRRSRIAEVAPKETRTLQGRILDRDGLPIPGVRVHYDPPSFLILKGLDKAVPVPLQLESDERAVRNAATDREGTFLFENLPTEPIVLTFQKANQNDVLTTIPAEALEIEFTLPTEQ